jgi:hypothetical protein
MSIHRAPILVCMEEHGCGEITFPPLDDLEVRYFTEPKTPAELRREAKKNGWSRHGGLDYCDICTESQVWK